MKNKGLREILIAIRRESESNNPLRKIMDEKIDAFNKKVEDIKEMQDA